MTQPGADSSVVEYREQRPSQEDFLRLFASTGWTTSLTPDRLVGALDASWHCVCAFESDRLIGMGRTISDGALHALIVEVIVEPDWQGRGVGRGIMARLVRRCREAGIDQVQLFCAAGKRRFYERQGFAARPDEAPGMELRAE
jgi:GNAT superfamily N-acetyltransferase